MNKSVHLYLIGLLILPLTGLLLNSQFATASSVRPLLQDENSEYNMRIEASQWEYKVFDLNAISLELGRPAKEADFVDSRSIVDEFEIKHKIGVTGDASKSFARDAVVNLFIYTRDVQHGFSINEVNIAVATNRPAPGDVWGAVSQASFITPDEDVTYSAFCHIFCGLGHPDMKIKFVIGEGSFEFGPIIFWSAIGLNVIILAFVAKSIFSKVK